MKRTFPLILVFIFGILGIIPFLVPHPVVQNGDEFLRNEFLRILAAFALVLGLGSLLKVHIDKIKKKRENWQYSWVLIITFLISSIIGLFGGVGGTGILPTRIGAFQFDIWTIYWNIVPAGFLHGLGCLPGISGAFNRSNSAPCRGILRDDRCVTSWRPNINPPTVIRPVDNGRAKCCRAKGYSVRRGIRSTGNRPEDHSGHRTLLARRRW